MKNILAFFLLPVTFFGMTVGIILAVGFLDKNSVVPSWCLVAIIVFFMLIDALIRSIIYFRREKFFASEVTTPSELTLFLYSRFAILEVVFCLIVVCNIIIPEISAILLN